MTTLQATAIISAVDRASAVFARVGANAQRLGGRFGAATAGVTITPEPPVADTYVKSARPFAFAFQGQARTSVPSGWVGRIPRVVANRLVKDGAARMLPQLVIVEITGDEETSPTLSGSRVRRKRLVAMTPDEATTAVARGNATISKIPATDENYVEKFGSEISFWRGSPLELGVLDAAPIEAEIVADEDGEPIEPDAGLHALADYRFSNRAALGDAGGPPPVVGPVAIEFVPLSPPLPVSPRQQRKRQASAATDSDTTFATSRVSDTTRIR